MISIKMLAPAFLLFCLTGAAEPATEKSIVATGESWSYYAVEGEPAAGWKTGTGTRGWKTGPTVIGWGEADQATEFAKAEGASKRFPAAYFRKSVRISKADRSRDLKLILVCDDGCIAFVNGTEIGRARMPEGPAKPYTAETASMRPESEFTVPRALIKKDRNIFAVVVYQSSAESSDMRFDATIVAN